MADTIGCPCPDCEAWVLDDDQDLSDPRNAMCQECGGTATRWEGTCPKHPDADEVPHG